jgi:hypothetical protein
MLSIIELAGIVLAAVAVGKGLVYFKGRRG